MQNLRLIFLLTVLSWGMQACFLDRQNDLTVVKGQVTNNITGAGLANIPVEIYKCQGGLMAITQCDDYKTLLSDGNGNFETSFHRQKGYFYTVGIGRNDFYEFTGNAVDGRPINLGEENIINFELTPITVLEVTINTTKQQKNYVHLYLEDNEPSNFSLYKNIVQDTSRISQNINRTFYFKIYPKKQYKITKILCNRKSVLNQESIFKDCANSVKEFYVDYVDTTRITIN